MATAPTVTSLSYLFSREGSRVIAHCLNLDLVASGTDINSAEQSLNALVEILLLNAIQSGNFANLEFRAPDEYWDRLPQAAPMKSGLLKLDSPPMVVNLSRHREMVLTISRFDIGTALSANPMPAMV